MASVYLYKSTTGKTVRVKDYSVTVEPGLQFDTPNELLDPFVGTLIARFDDGVSKSVDQEVPVYANPISGFVTQGGLPLSQSGGVATYYPPTDDTAGILVAAYAANAAGGGVVKLKPMTYNLTASLPLYKNVVYQGARSSLTFTSIADGGTVTPRTGTWLIGNGTFDGFAGNAVDGVAQYPSQAAFANDSIMNAGVYDIGLSNFRNGITAGSNYNPGLLYAEVSNVIAINCAGWGFWFENCMHVRYGKIVSLFNTAGQFRSRASSVSAILQPANCDTGEIICSIPGGNATSWGIVISAANGTLGGISEAGTLQCNHFNTAVVSQPATMAAASVNVTVTDGSKFIKFSPVSFDATQNGFTANQIYFVVSVTGNVLQLANSPNGAAISATGSTAVNIVSRGMPCLAVFSEDATSGAFLTNVANLDLEAGGTTKLLVHGATAPFVYHATNVQTGGSIQDVVLRNSNSNGMIIAGNALNYDVDGSSIQNFLLGGTPGASSVGSFGALYQMTSAGNVKSFNLAQFKGSFGALGGNTLVNVQPGNCDWTYPGIPLGQRTYVNDNTTQTINSNFGGAATYNGAGGTWTFLAAAANMLGWETEITNAGAGTLVLATNGTDLFNLKTGLTSINLLTKASVKIRCAKTGSGTFYWAVVAIGGTYSAGTITGI